MKDRIKGSRVYIVSFAAFIAAIILGLAVPGMFKSISWIGDVYINLLKLMVIPLLMTEVAFGIYSAYKSAAKSLLKTIVLFILMFAASFLLTAVLTAAVRPGDGLDLLGQEWTAERSDVSISSFFKTLIPSNIFTAMSSGSILPCILFSAACGFAAAKVKADSAMRVIDELKNVFRKVLSYIMWLTPLGVFCLMGSTVAEYGGEVIGVCAKYILTAWIGCVVVTLLVMILPVWIFAGVSPVKYLKGVGPIWLLTLSTCSSVAVLPNTIRVCNEKFNVPEKITGIVVPLGCTIHMCGGAVSFCLLGMFTMQMAGLPISAGTLLYMLFVSTLMNMAAPGIPGGGIVLGATYLSILGAPTGFIGIYSGIYRLLDMAYTTLNVTGDITANILIAKSEERS